MMRDGPTDMAEIEKTDLGVLFQASFMLNPDIVFVHDLEGKMILVNPAARESMGYEQDEMEEMTLAQLTIDPPEAIRERMGALARGQELRFDSQLRRKDGSVFNVKVRTKAVIDGDRTMILGVSRDNTKEHLANLLESALDQMSSFLTSGTDLDALLRSVLDHAMRAVEAENAILAYKEGDRWAVRYVAGNSVINEGDTFTTEDSNTVRIVSTTRQTVAVQNVLEDRRVNKAFADRLGVRSMLTAPLEVQGEVMGTLSFHHRTRVGAFNDAHVDFARRLARALSMVLQNSDLYERGQALNEQLRTVVSTVPDGIVMLDKEGRLTFANTEAERLVGIPREEMLGRRHDDPSWGLSWMDGQHEGETLFGMAVREKRQIQNARLSLRRPDGRRIALSANMTPILNEEGEVDKAIGSFTDITEMVLREEELNRQRRDYQIVFDSVPAMIALKDLKSNVIRANPAFRRGFGPSEEEVVEGWSPRGPFAGDYRRDDLEVINSGRPKLGILEQFVTPSGEIRWARVDKIPYTDDQGNIAGVLLFGLDITEQKMAREELVRERDLLTTLMETAPTGILVFYRDGRIIISNTAAQDMLGVRHEELLGKRYDSSDWRISDFAGTPLEEERYPVRRVLDTGQPVYDAQLALIRPGGESIFLQVNAAPLYVEGRMTGVITTLQDVSEIVRKEEALAMSTRSSESIVEKAPSGMLIFDYQPPSQLVLRSANPAAEAMLGELGNSIGREFDQIWGERFMVKKEELLKTASIGSPLWLEEAKHERQGLDRAYNIRAFRLPGDRVCVYMDDVTDQLMEGEMRRRAYAQIEQNIEGFATLIDRIRNPLYAIVSHAERCESERSSYVMRRAEEIDQILQQLDQGWLNSERVRAFLKKNL